MINNILEKDVRTNARNLLALLLPYVLVDLIMEFVEESIQYLQEIKKHNEHTIKLLHDNFIWTNPVDGVDNRSKVVFYRPIFIYDFINKNKSHIVSRLPESILQSDIDCGHLCYLLDKNCGKNITRENLHKALLNISPFHI